LKTSSRSALQAAAAIAVVRRRGVEIWGINTIAKAVFGIFGGVLTPGNIFESQNRLVFVIEKDKMLGAPSSIYMYLDDIEIGEYMELGA
jgi:hypothetical protein